MMWYLDCYSWKAACGKEFPVNSYCSESLTELIAVAARILCSDLPGIDEIRISRETKGQNPTPL
jgi:hypothetical protein